jgi:3-deoxy-manno-octulosonate cytidylyltransferase (CMP-KDO synthetase)
MPGLSAPGTSFQVLIPARLGSTRLARKPLADIGGLPMVVQVARRAAASGASAVVVCADEEAIVQACAAHGVRAILTRSDHPTGTDRLAEACRRLGLDPAQIVVNVQGDEPLIPPDVIAAVAARLERDGQCEIATAAHRLHESRELFDPNVVKVVTDGRGRALLFSRAPIPWSRDEFAARPDGQSAGALPADLPALRHVGLYAYRAGFLLRFPELARPALEKHESLEQLRALYHGCAIAVLELDAPLPHGVDTPADLERARAALAAGG